MESLRTSSSSGSIKHSTSNGYGYDSHSDDESSPLVGKKRHSGDVSSSETCSKKQAVSSHTGPDRVVPADTLMTWEADKPVKLHLADEGPLSVKPISIMTAFKQTLRDFPDNPALAFKESNEDDWEIINYREYYSLVWKAAKAFIKVGLEPYHGVGIIGFNSPEWFISDLGCIFAGGLATGIYTTNSPDACRYVAHSARCNVIVVENDQQLQKILAVRDQLPHLKAIVQYRGQLKERYSNVYMWKDFLKLGDQVSDEELEVRFRQQAPNKCCTLIYTSGTTGDPKGVMLSHDNLLWTARAGLQQGSLVKGQEVLVSYLPLSHVAAQILDLFVPLLSAAVVYFAQPDALKGSLGDTLKEVRPTAFLGVPRVWEKIQEKMVAAAKTQWRFQIMIARWAKTIGLAGNLSLMNGGSVPYGWTIANFLVFRKVRNALGFDRCKFCMTAAAPIMKDTLDFFMSLNIPIMEIYGMSETTGPHTISFPWKYRTVSVGVELYGSTTKFTNPDKDGCGEVCMNGRNMFMGYLNMEDKTRETLDEGGWVKSGDVGRRDSGGFIFITGRIKELLITAGGENISPILIEDAIKERLPCVSNAMLIGDRRKYLTVLLTMKTEVDPETSDPSDRLTRSTISWFQQRNVKVETVSQMLSRCEKSLLAVIQKGIDEVNERAVSRAQFIQKWSILPVDFSISGAELGPTLKLKRSVVLEKYRNTIDDLYVDSDQ